MKKIILLFISVVLLFSCKKDQQDKPFEETISSGKKWGIQIGSSPAAVYTQIQKMSKEKEFSTIIIANQKTYSKPEELKDRLELYQGLSLEKTDPAARLFFQFYQGKIVYIADFSTNPSDLTKWPKDATDEMAIHKNDPVNTLYAKLVNLYKIPAYANYKMRLSVKQLDTAFDQDMAVDEEWDFNFSVPLKVNDGTMGSSYVRLIFKNNKLSLIKHSYTVGIVYN
ncbi:hypothetical protein [Pedobacter sp. HMWF019]|uniref:hypothetical protein n=1 Tax=Pedobacter sp. HMWF019 TaxID=2056856 RepID=UPI0011B1CC74|nr:hypothetical protein [Pedobacter sp. HMWF019]